MMDEEDRIRYSRRAEVEKRAREIVDEEIKKNRESVGVVAATQQAWEVAAAYQREQYEAIERELDAGHGYGNAAWFKS